LKRQENPNYTGDETFNFFPVCLIPFSKLSIFEYHRLVKDKAIVNSPDFLEEIKKYFHKIPSGHLTVQPLNKKEFGLYFQGKAFLLQLKPLTKNDSIDDSLKVRHYEFVFLTNKSKKKIFIANEKQEKEINHKSEFKFGRRPKPLECIDSDDIDECTNKFINKHIVKIFNYPSKAVDNNIEGTVECEFYIDEEGSVSIKKLDGPHKILENEAERIIKKLPSFTPGSIKEIPSKFLFIIPITFRLE
jgi:TonB family protein